MNNTMMLGLFALGGLAFFLLRGRVNAGNGGGSLSPMMRREPLIIDLREDPSMILAPPAAQRRPDNPPMFTGRNRLPEDADLDIGI